MVAAMAHCLPLLFPQMSEERCERITQHIYSRAVSRQQRMNADHPTVQLFWEIYDLLNSKSDDIYFPEELLNHASDAQQIAISLPHFLQECSKNRIDAPSVNELKALLISSRARKFIGQKAVRSKLLKKVLHCWVFEKSSTAKEAKP
jgi:hypothetical protein